MCQVLIGFLQKKEMEKKLKQREKVNELRKITASRMRGGGRGGGRGGHENYYSSGINYGNFGMVEQRRQATLELARMRQRVSAWARDAWISRY